MPVLPTREVEMNRYIEHFNELLLHDRYLRHTLGVWMPALYSFLDNRRLLDLKLTRDGDTIHLGSIGMSRFVRLIKDSIYHRERVERSVRQQGNSRPPGGGFYKPP